MADNEKLLTYSPSPHIKHPRTTRRIMIDVCIALIPAAIMGIVYFGLKALLLIALSVITAELSEAVYLLIRGKKIDEIIKKFDFSSCVTGLLMGLTVGTNYPWYSVIFGAAFSVIVVKMLFGGTGKNVVNPAVTGRIFVFMSFQSVVGKWIAPSVGSVSGGAVETGATIIEGLMKGSLPSLSNLDLFLGTGLPGCIGETCKLALIVGGIYLAVRKVINPLYPVIYVGVAGLFSVALKGFDFNYFLPSVLSGGLIIGAIFMATDYTTTPNTLTGNVVYFVLLGLLTAGLREATDMEVTSFAILLMNLLVPLFDKFIISRPFGYKRAKKVKGGTQ